MDIMDFIEHLLYFVREKSCFRIWVTGNSVILDLQGFPVIYIGFTISFYFYNFNLKWDWEFQPCSDCVWYKSIYHFLGKTSQVTLKYFKNI